MHSALLIDMAGNVITNVDDGQCSHDIHMLAALAAGNFGAMSAMAEIVGGEEFSLLFHKGKNKNIHFSKITSDFLLISIFGKDVLLGLVRLRVVEAIVKIQTILKQCKDESSQ